MLTGFRASFGLKVTLMSHVTLKKLLEINEKKNKIFEATHQKVVASKILLKSPLANKFHAK